MQATDILQSEHRVIEQVLACLEKMVDESIAAQKLDEAPARQAIEFFQTFADHCHHAKEEDHLFPLLESRGLPRSGGPTGVMMHEHQEGRDLLRAMKEAVPGASAGKPEAVRDFARFARAYVELLRQHISKEDHCLFAMADRVLTEEDDATLVERFAATELHGVPSGAHERCLAVAQSLAQRYRLPETMPGVCGCSHAHVS